MHVYIFTVGTQVSDPQDQFSATWNFKWSCGNSRFAAEISQARKFKFFSTEIVKFVEIHFKTNV